MRVLITGATGFIGRHLATRLADEHEVIGLVRRLPDAPLPGVDYCVQELTAPLDLTRLPAQVDAVIHQAALIDTAAAANDVADDAAPFLANVVATWRLLRYAEQAGATRFLHASTGGVSGSSPHLLREDDPFNPQDLYSLTKSQAELAVRHTPTPFPTVILRYFFPYGAGTPNPIPGYITRALAGETIALPAGGGPRFNPIHIRDTVEATVAALALDSDAVLNIAGTEITTFGAIAEFAAQRVGKRVQFATLPAEQVIPYYRADLVADVTRMRHVLGYQPQVTLLEGLSELVDALAARA